MFIKLCSIENICWFDQEKDYFFFINW